jgi:CRISP-associated protein Cas1
MSYHIISIDSPQCSLSCRDGQLTCRTPGMADRSVPLEDVASIIITSFSAQIHSHLLLEAARHGVSLIVCESYKPASLVLPACRSTDTLLSRAQVSLPEKTRKRLWELTVDAKCRNQISLARHLRPDAPEIGDMERITAGKNPAKESTVARFFWRVYGAAVSPPAGATERSFLRNPKSDGLNSLLNYGYAVLLSTVLQKLFAVGLDPTFGIAHAARERSTPLAYDLMEPFRPCVDWRVAQWIARDAGHLAAGVTPDFRKWVTGFPLERIEHLDYTLDVRSCAEAVIRSFRRAVIQDTPRLYKPWIPKNSKWAGCSSPSTSPS